MTVVCESFLEHPWVQRQVLLGAAELTWPPAGQLASRDFGSESGCGDGFRKPSPANAQLGGVLVSRGVITSRGVDYTVCPARNGASAQLGPPMMQGPPVPPPTRTYISILTNHYYMCLVSRVGPREHPATPVLRTWTKFTNNSPGLALYNGPTAA
uniref:Uncharacterized protein n=1 Tax=Vespula pensylvanica TaxID=30213 RepID=A0A834N0M6_VESPE|nr:hypothetical protein H0235_017339 [Vespula pensylvanica]